MRGHGLTRALAIVLAIVAVGAACSRTTEQAAQTARPVTFNADIAPILFNNCASCHRPIDQTAPPVATSGADEDPICVAGAPFSVLDYPSVRRHARAIAAAVQRRAMPPWLPQPGHGEFMNERRLRDDQIRVIAQWADDGAVEGDAHDRPTPPKTSGGWQLGTPDLVLTLPQPYALRPGERDVFRNFVIPLSVATT